MSENELSKLVVDLCFKIHKQYGPGLFEIVYEEIFCHEWEKNKIPFTRQHPIPLIHEEIKMDAGFRADMIIDNPLAELISQSMLHSTYRLVEHKFV